MAGTDLTKTIPSKNTGATPRSAKSTKAPPICSWRPSPSSCWGANKPGCPKPRRTRVPAGWTPMATNLVAHNVHSVAFLEWWRPSGNPFNLSRFNIFPAQLPLAHNLHLSMRLRMGQGVGLVRFGKQGLDSGASCQEKTQPYAAACRCVPRFLRFDDMADC